MLDSDQGYIPVGARRTVVAITDGECYFGSIANEIGTSVALSDARQCISHCQNALDAAAEGPFAGARLSATVPLLVLHGVKVIAACTDDAAEKWRTHK